MITRREKKSKSIKEGNQKQKRNNLKRKQIFKQNNQNSRNEQSKIK